MIQKAETAVFRMAAFGSRCRYFALVTVLVVFVETACYVDTVRPRVVFPTEEAAERYFAEHRDEFTNLAIAWLASGHSHLAVIDREWFEWNECWVSPSWWWFEVRQSNGHEFVVEKVRTINDAALKCGTTRPEIVKWQECLAALRLGEITLERAVKGRMRFSYVELSFLESTQPYGFRYAPRADPLAQRELMDLVGDNPKAGLKMTDLGDGWFYFEGLWTSAHLPFIRGARPLIIHAALDERRDGSTF